VTHHSPGVSADKLIVKRAVWLLTSMLLLTACGTESTTTPRDPSAATTTVTPAAIPPTTTAPPSSVPATTTTTEPPAGRRAPEAPAPDGPCDNLEIRSSVFVVFGRSQLLAGCTKIAPSQRLLMANFTGQPIALELGLHRVEVPPTDRDYTEAGRAGELLAPGVHLLGDRQYWLVDEPPMRFASTPIELGRFGAIELGMTVRDIASTVGATLLVNPRFASFDGHPLPSAGSNMAPFGAAYFETYDGSAPMLTLRANGSDPLDATVIWISPANGTVPSAVRVGWTEAQVRDVYGASLVDAQGLTCVRPNQTVLLVFDGPPITGAHRLWFHFEDGRLSTVSTSSVTLGETGVLDC
jgi:hypothetical protein